MSPIIKNYIVWNIFSDKGTCSYSRIFTNFYSF